MDEILIMAFKRDDPFTMDNRYFYELESGEIVWTGDGSEYEEAAYIGKDRWIEVPAPTHHEWHTAFNNYLKQLERPDLYRSSIGQSLKLMTDDERYGWYEFTETYAEEKASEWLKEINRLNG